MGKKVISFVVVIVLLVFTILYSAVAGRIDVSMFDLVKGLFTGSSNDVEVIKDLRCPRISIALFTGAALSVSEALLKAVMRNPLAEAGFMGVSSGAASVSVLRISIFPTLFFFVPLFAFIGGALAFILVYSFSWKSGLDPLRMILIGVAINAAFTGLLQVFSFTGGSMVQAVSDMTMSNLSMKKWSDVEIIVLYGSIGLVLALFVYGWCNYLALED